MANSTKTTDIICYAKTLHFWLEDLVFLLQGCYAGVAVGVLVQKVSGSVPKWGNIFHRWTNTNSRNEHQGYFLGNKRQQGQVLAFLTYLPGFEGTLHGVQMPQGITFFFLNGFLITWLQNLDLGQMLNGNNQNSVNNEIHPGKEIHF